jgi:hypothetical protein
VNTLISLCFDWIYFNDVCSKQEMKQTSLFAQIILAKVGYAFEDLHNI